MPFRLIVPEEVREEMIAHAQQELPRECCGLLAGTLKEGEGRVLEVYRLTNALGSAVEYESEPGSMLQAMRAIDGAGLRVLAVYHSHPSSAAVPSRKDLERNPWGDWAAHFIISLAETEARVQAWWLSEDSFTEAEWRVG